MSYINRFSQLIYMYILIILMRSTRGILTRGPTDVYTVKGSTVVLPCSTNLEVPVLWVYDRVGGEVYWDGLFKDSLGPRYSISTDPTFNQYNLTITDVQLEDAGTYRCVDDEGYGYDLYLDGIPNNVATAELSVTEDNLRCWSSINGQNLAVETFNNEYQHCSVINTSCSITYGGNVPPTLQWSLHRTASLPVDKVVSLQRFEQSTVTTIGEYSQISSRLVLSVSRWMNQSYISCRLSGLGDTAKVDTNTGTRSSDIKWQSLNITVEDIDIGRFSLRRKCTKTSVIESNVAITGVTVVDNEIFATYDVVAQVKVFGLQSLTPTREIPVNMKWPFGVAGSSLNKALYIIDSADGFRCVHRVDIKSGSVTRWNFSPTEYPWGVTVTPDHKIMVTLQIGGTQGQSVLVEFSDQGDRTLVINLSTDIDYVYQTLPLSGGLFIVSHGNDGSQRSNHRVCLVNTRGEVVKCHGVQRGSGEGQLSGPHSVTIDKNTEHILIADGYNNRIIMLDSYLNFLADIHNVNAPYRLHFDSATDRLFVGEQHNSNGRLLVISN